MKVENSTVSTTGDSSPAIMIADGGGILIADGGSFTTSGAMSQGIYSKGDVTVTNASVNALNAKAAVLKGNNTITLSGTTLEGKETADTIPYNIVLFSDEKISAPWAPSISMSAAVLLFPTKAACSM